MHSSLIIVEWLSAFFLAAEAIKLYNLEIISFNLQKAANRISPISRLLEHAHDVGQAEKIAGTIIHAFTFVGLLIILAAAVYFGFDLDSTVRQLSSHQKSWSGALIFTGTALLVLLAAFACGFVIYLLVVRVMRLVVFSLRALERNTANGIVGIIGFLLFSAVSIAKLLGVE
jgi:hypothetical protein